MSSDLRQAASAREAARRLYLAVVERARADVFYREFGVPDTIDGRFDLLALHAFLIMTALKERGAAGEKIGTRFATSIFEGLEQALRELGVGDLGLSRRIKAMADAFYGRLEAYGAAGSEAELAAVLVRNLYRGDAARSGEARVLATYAIGATHLLKEEGPGTDLLAGSARFGPLPKPEPEHTSA